MQKGVEIRVRADATQAKRELRNLEKSVASIEQTTNKVSKAFRNLAIGITAAFTGAGLTRAITSATDSLTNLENRIALVVGQGQELQGTMRKLYGIAQRSRMPVNSAAETFNRFGLALQGSGKSIDELLIATEAVQQAAVISGASAESANAAITQLGQGLASGELRGEELNSVLEQMPRLARAIADGMGVPFGELRALAKDGKLNAESVFQAIISTAGELDNEFKTIKATTSGLVTVLKDELTRALGAIDRELGFSESLRKRIIAATNSLRFFADNLEVAVGQARGKLRLFLNDLVLFRYEVKETLKDLFTSDFEVGSITDPIVRRMESAYNRIKKIFDEEIIPKIKPIDFDNVFQNTEAALVSIKTFVSNVIAEFTHLWRRIVGQSLWTGIFDPAHEEQGKASIGNTSALSSNLNAALDTISKWVSSIVTKFDEVYEKVTKRWDEFKTYLSTNQLTVSTISFNSMSTAWDSTIKAMQDRWDSFVKATRNREQESDRSGSDIPFAVSFLNALDILDSRFNSTMDNIESRWKAFNDEMALRNQEASRMGGKSDPLASLFNGLADAPGEIKVIIDANSKRIVEDFKTVLSAVAATPVFTTGKIVFESVLGAATGENTVINQFLSDLDGNKEKIGVILAGAIFAGFKFGFGRVVVSGLVVLNANEILNSTEFQDSVNSFGKGLGKLLYDTISGDGDIGKQIVDGIAASLASLGAGVAEGLFGSEFESEVANGMVGALTAGLILVTISKAGRAALISLGGKMITAMLGSAWIAQLGTYFAAQAAAVFGSSTIISPALSGVLNTLGLKMGAIIQGGLVVGLVAGLALAASSAIEYASKSLYDLVDRTVRGESSEEQGLRQAQRILELVNKGEEGVRRAAFLVDSGKVSAEALATLGEENLERLRTAIDGTEATWVDSAISLGFFNTSIDNFADAVNLAATKLRRNPELAAPLYKASGGYISGAGGPTEDKIPAMLSNGEYVIKSSSVSKFGKEFLDRLNMGMLPQMFSSGGMVTPYDDEIAGISSDINRMERIGDPTLTNAIVASNAVLDDLRARRRRYISSSGEVDLSAIDGGGASASSGSGGKGKGKGKKSDAVKAAESYALGFKNDFKSALSNALKTGDFGEFLPALLDSFTGKIIDSFVDGFTDSLFEGLIGKDGEGIFSNIFGGITSFGADLGKGAQEGILEGLTSSEPSGGFGSLFSGLLGMDGGGGLFSSIFGSSFGSFLGFSSGGVVPNTPFSKSGSDSVPALLTPGELVVPENSFKDFMDSQSGGGTTVVNLSVTGDISRQTRTEIAKMIPEITAGVNMTNKETNFRGR